MLQLPRESGENFDWFGRFGEFSVIFEKCDFLGFFPIFLAGFPPFFS